MVTLRCPSIMRTIVSNLLKPIFNWHFLMCIDSVMLSKMAQLQSPPCLLSSSIMVWVVSRSQAFVRLVIVCIWLAYCICALTECINRSLVKDTQYTEELVETSTGKVLVARAGERNPSKPVILTYHDLGLNYVSNYQAFFNFPEMKEITNRLVIHITWSGQAGF